MFNHMIATSLDYQPKHWLITVSNFIPAMTIVQAVPSSTSSPKLMKMSASARQKLVKTPVKKLEENGDHHAIVQVDNKFEKPKHFKSAHLLEYHRTFFNLGFFLLIIPFRLVGKEKNGQHAFKFHQNRVQQVSLCILVNIQSGEYFWCDNFQVLCGILQSLVMYEYISSIRLQSFENLDGTPMSYLHVATYIASFFYVLFFIYVFWAKRKLFKRMLNGIQSMEFAKNPGKYAFLKVNVRKGTISP